MSVYIMGFLIGWGMTNLFRKIYIVESWAMVVSGTLLALEFFKII